MRTFAQFLRKSQAAATSIIKCYVLDNLFLRGALLKGLDGVRFNTAELWLGGLLLVPTSASY